MRSSKTWGWITIGIVGWVWLVSGCSSPPPPESAALEPSSETGPGYTATIEAWRQERHASLEEPDSWLTLVGLFWLEEGAQTCGSGAENDLVFPPAAPERLGTLYREERVVRFSAAPDVEVRIGDEPITEAVLTTTEDEPVIVSFGTFSFFVIERGDRIGIRLKDSASPVRQHFTGIESFPIDPAFRFPARFVPYDPPQPIRVPNVLGTTNEQDCPGALEFQAAGELHRLDVLPGGEDEFFVIFADATTGQETYGGGRFLYTPLPDETGHVDLDFNKAYNPPCVFTPYATCPLPPAQNRLALAVRAGEKTWGEH